MLIVDGHCDTLWAAKREERDWTQHSVMGHADLPRMIAAGVNIQFFALFSDPDDRVPGYALRGAGRSSNAFYAGMGEGRSEWGSAVILRLLRMSTGPKAACGASSPSREGK